MRTTRCLETRTLVSVMSAAELNMDDYDADGPLNWWTVCEAHSTLVGHSTRSIAIDWASNPTMWCEECRADVVRRLPITLPLVFLEAWQESEGALEEEAKQYPDNPTNDATLRLIDQVESAPAMKRGGRTVTLLPDEAAILLREAIYLWEYNNGDGRNQYGIENPDPAVRYATKTMIDKLRPFVNKGARA